MQALELGATRIKNMIEREGKHRLSVFFLVLIYFALLASSSNNDAASSVPVQRTDKVTAVFNLCIIISYIHISSHIG